MSAQLLNTCSPVPAPVFEPRTFRLQGPSAAQSTANSVWLLTVDR
jgi:hypothetical protein